MPWSRKRRMRSCYAPRHLDGMWTLRQAQTYWGEQLKQCQVLWHWLFNSPTSIRIHQWYQQTMSCWYQQTMSRWFQRPGRPPLCGHKNCHVQPRPLKSTWHAACNFYSPALFGNASLRLSHVCLWQEAVSKPILVTFVTRGGSVEGWTLVTLWSKRSTIYNPEIDDLVVKKV